MSQLYDKGLNHTDELPSALTQYNNKTRTVESKVQNTCMLKGFTVKSPHCNLAPSELAPLVLGELAPLLLGELAPVEVISPG